ncbi:MAG: pantetheine-phosphate adenylyltransferase [Nitrospiraceae bacterium]|nr:MAG: pantetheine-phosphate adenylyltransferase [Nitrospiraceae bacterium]
MSKIAIYPGTFDPLTNGHIDLIQRTLKIFDEVIIAVAPSYKKQPLFTTKERIGLIKSSTKGLKGARVESFHNLLVDYVKNKKSIAIIRGLRAISDFEYELQMALMNRRLDAHIETVFMMPSDEYTFLSSTLVKEVASFGGSVTGLVPKAVEEALKKKLRKRHL